jgi:hypothetical protein
MNTRAQLARIRSLAGFALGIAAVTFTAVVKNGALTVTAEVSTSDAAVLPVSICDDNGKIKLFKDVDDFVTQSAKLALFNVSGVTMEFNNLEALDPAPFSGDYVKKAQATIAAYAAKKVIMAQTVAALLTVLALMPSTTAAEIAVKAEKTAQKDAVEAQIAWLTAENTRIAALLGS